jgi:hypothetical protein
VDVRCYEQDDHAAAARAQVLEALRRREMVPVLVVRSAKTGN